MDPQTIYDKWRQNRSQAEPAAGFPARVMESIRVMQSNRVIQLNREPPVPGSNSSGHSRSQGFLRIGLCAAAVLAALFRVVELFNLFAAGSLEN